MRYGLRWHGCRAQALHIRAIAGHLASWVWNVECLPICGFKSSSRSLDMSASKLEVSWPNLEVASRRVQDGIEP
jgi:hypothetical protein